MALPDQLVEIRLLSGADPVHPGARSAGESLAWLVLFARAVLYLGDYALDKPIT